MLCFHCNMCHNFGAHVNMKQQTCDIVGFMYIVDMHITNLHFQQLVCEACLGYSKYHLFSWVHADA
jgi:hypothetical protein